MVTNTGVSRLYTVFSPSFYAANVCRFNSYQKIISNRSLNIADYQSASYIKNDRHIHSEYQYKFTRKQSYADGLNVGSSGNYAPQTFQGIIIQKCQISRRKYSVSAQANGILSSPYDGVSRPGTWDVEDDDEDTCKVPEDEDETVTRKEYWVENIIFNFRFLTVLGVLGSLLGSLLCFLQGSYLVAVAGTEYATSLWNRGHGGAVIFSLIEAVDVYLMGTVLMIFGVGLHNLFIRSTASSNNGLDRSSLFGIFRLSHTPSWVKIESLEEMKTKLGHVIVMILLVGMFKEAKQVTVNSGADFVALAASVFLSSASLCLLNLLTRP